MFKMLKFPISQRVLPPERVHAWITRRARESAHAESRERDGARRAPGDVDEFRCGDVEGPRSLAGEECDEAPDAPDVHPGERPPDGERPVPGERAWPGERDAERTDS